MHHRPHLNGRSLVAFPRAFANISHNMLLGAINAFTDKAGCVVDATTGTETEVWQAAEHYRDQKGGSVVVAEDNYGEGSSREHAAMEPRYLGVKAVLVKVLPAYTKPT